MACSDIDSNHFIFNMEIEILDIDLYHISEAIFNATVFKCTKIKQT